MGLCVKYIIPLKTYCNQHLQKNRARASPFHYYGTAGSAPGPNRVSSR
jgi:hypothetical protein